MALQTVDVSYRTVSELESPDLWDQYELYERRCRRAYERPREQFGITEVDDGKFLSQLRVVDPGGESINEIRRCRSSLHKAQDSLNHALKRIPDDWQSESIFYRIIAFVEQGYPELLEGLVIALGRMKVDNKILPRFEPLINSSHGFKMAVDGIAKAGTEKARAMLVKVAKQVRDDEEKTALLNDAAVTISVKLHDRRVIPVLVDRLTKAYSELPSETAETMTKKQAKSSEHSKIIEDLLSVVYHSHAELSPRLLHQLAALGVFSHQGQSPQVESVENPDLGINQAIISRDLRPIREAAVHELERRKMAS